MRVPLGRLQGQAIYTPPSMCHVSCYSPAGGGKSTGFCIPWLLTFEGSCIVLDPKSELYRETHEARRRLGNKVYRLDPYSLCGPGDSFNPLSIIESSGADCVEDARVFGEAMVVRSGQGENDPHWNDSAAIILTAIVSLILTRLPGEDRNLSSLRELLSDEMVLQSSAKILKEMDGIFPRLGGQLAQLSKSEKEASSVLSVAHRHTTFLDSMAILGCMKANTIDFEALLQGNAIIYIILPAYHIESQSRWIRLTITALVRLLGRKGMRDGKECLFLLDEAGTALGGHLPALDQALALLRGSGARVALFFQSIGQLKENFKDHEQVVLDNTSKIFMGVQGYETAELVSKMLGEQTITISTANTNTGKNWNEGIGSNSAGHNRGAGMSYSEHGRALLKPEEVLALDRDVFLAFFPGVRPVIAKRLKSYADPLFGTARRISTWNVPSFRTIGKIIGFGYIAVLVLFWLKSMVRP